jgi:CheY-like chemotaxis protein
MKKAILTIEGNDALSYVISSVLKDYAVTNVNTCSEAITQLQNDKDLIILDIPNAGSENLELLKHMSSSAVLNNIPTVVISNSDDPTLKDKAVELGASLFLTKPFDPVYLSDKVKDLIYEDGETPSKKRKLRFNLNIF